MATYTPSLHAGLIERSRGPAFKAGSEPEPRAEPVVPLFPAATGRTELDRLLATRRETQVPATVFATVPRKTLTVRVEPGLRARLDTVRGARTIQSVLHAALSRYLDKAH